MSNVSNSWNMAIDEYLRHLEAYGRAKTTIRLHRHYLGLMRDVADTPGAMTATRLELYLGAKKWKQETRKSARGVARVFFAWLYDNGHIDTNPAGRLEAVRVPAGVPRPCPRAVIDEAIRSNSERVRLMIMFGAVCGLRACEIAKLHSSDFDGSCLYVTGKGGKTRFIPLEDSRLCRALKSADGYLFPSPVVGHAHLTAGTVTKLVSEALGAGWTCHKLRHAFATKVYSVSKNLFATQKLLGHASPTTTQRYVDISFDVLAEVMRAAA